MTSTKIMDGTSQLRDVAGIAKLSNGPQPHPKKFTIDVPDALQQDLKARLGTTRYPEQLAGAGWEMGTERTYLQDLVQYWRTDFNWGKQQRWLNTHFHNFKMEVDGINMHFVHHKSELPNARPILLIHGWPGSFIEFHAIIPKLTAAGYDVVAPSLPGYAFSSPPTRKGFGARQMAAILDKLMRSLGYPKYFCQGGDWGAIIGFIMGAKHSDSCKGLHTNMPLGEPLTTSPWALAQWLNASLPFLNKTPLALSAAEIRGLAQTEHFIKQETGYSKIQATKPQTLGYALNDSPTGLAAWITEKFHTWTDCDGNIENCISRDLLLTNISLYWFSGCITSSCRLYYESFTQRQDTFRQLYCKTPTAASRFPKELYVLPKAWTAACYNLKQWREHKQGGHFAALEQPDVLVQDMLDFYKTLEL